MSKTAPPPDLAPSPEERRLLNRALGCAVEEFIARFGAENAIRRVQAELRHARRARSRKLYGPWSAMLARIEIKHGPAAGDTEPKEQTAGRANG